eukprot:215890_1
MMKYHIRSIGMQAELFMTMAIDHNSGALHPRTNPGFKRQILKKDCDDIEISIRRTIMGLYERERCMKYTQEIKLERTILDAHELNNRPIYRPTHRSIIKSIIRSIIRPIHIHGPGHIPSHRFSSAYRFSQYELGPAHIFLHRFSHRFLYTFSHNGSEPEHFIRNILGKRSSLYYRHYVIGNIIVIYIRYIRNYFRTRYMKLLPGVLGLCLGTEPEYPQHFVRNILGNGINNFVYDINLEVGPGIIGTKIFRLKIVTNKNGQNSDENFLGVIIIWILWLIVVLAVYFYSLGFKKQSYQENIIRPIIIQFQCNIYSNNGSSYQEVYVDVFLLRLSGLYLGRRLEGQEQIMGNICGDIILTEARDMERINGIIKDLIILGGELNKLTPGGPTQEELNGA